MLSLKKRLMPLEKRTEYDNVKKTKRDNFTFLNGRFCEKGQVVLLGDSITEIWNVTDLFGQFTKETGLAVYNRGISGDTSDRLLERIKNNVTSIEPKLIVLLIGTNDLGVNSGNDFTEMNVRKILDVIKADCPNAKIILQAIYPVNPNVDKWSVGLRRNSDIKTVNAKLKKLAKEKNIVFADFTELLSDKNGNFKAQYTYDGLHPNAKGFAAVTPKLLKLMKEELQ